MTSTRAVPALAVAGVVAAVLAIACGGNESCPTAAAYPNTAANPVCSGPPQQVQITINLCEACSHTSPTCTADLSSVGTSQIFLDTRWEVCTDNSSCAMNLCSSATCQFSVAAGSYTVHALSPSGTSTFDLTVAPASSCSGWI